jgi:membrane protease YdiL (CAAX protease family)
MSLSAAATARAMAQRAAASTTTVVLVLGLIGAVGLRRGLAGVENARSVPAGAVFALLLFAMALAARGYSSTRWAWVGAGDQPAALRVTWAGTVGVAAAAVLCAAPLMTHLRAPGGALAFGEFPVWAAVVGSVSLAEEAFLRGALWSAVTGWRRGSGGPWWSLAVTSVAFALLHVPFYGPQVLPLDLAVGVLLGGLRQLSGGVAAPAVAHAVADLAGWWLR